MGGRVLLMWTEKVTDVQERQIQGEKNSKWFIIFKKIYIGLGEKRKMVENVLKKV